MHNTQSTELLFELSKPGCCAVRLPACDVPAKPLDALLPKDAMSDTPLPLPELSEPDVVRHFVNLSTRNFSVDTHFYPLGSCTMKYNPKRNERLAALPGLAALHPYQPESTLQGMLSMLHLAQHNLAEIAGLPAVSLQPAAGAHGEMTAMLVAAAYFRDLGQERTTVLIPDAAHGTNPASAAMAGFKTVAVKSRPDGFVDIDDLASKLDERTAVFMITNPNTLGLFEPRIERIAKMIHEAGGLVYLDGANMNAILGVTRPGDFGADLMHFNPHKTFSGPHGGGGPGAGPIAVAQRLADFLPTPVVVKDGRGYHLDYDRPKSIGRVRNFFGSVGVLVRMYCYIRTARAGRSAANCRRRGPQCELSTFAGEGHAAGTARRPLHARVRGVGRGTEEPVRHFDNGHRQAAVGLRFSRPDGLLPADRPRSDDDRADGEREQGDAGCLRRGVGADRRGVARIVAQCPAQHADLPAGRSNGGAEAGVAVEGEG